MSEKVIDVEISQVSADEAYDHLHCYDEIIQHGAKALIPPRKMTKSGSMAVPMLHHIPVTKISVISVNMDVKNGNVTQVIIDVL